MTLTYIPLLFSSNTFLRCLALSKAGRSDSETFVQASSVFLAEVIYSPGVPCISARGKSCQSVLRSMTGTMVFSPLRCASNTAPNSFL